MKIVVTGSVAYDYLMSFPGKFTDSLLADQLEKISLSFLVDSMKRMRGGTAPNIAYTLGLLGSRPLAMATVGQDFSEYRRWLEESGVDTTAMVEIEELYCASFFVNTDQDNNQIATFYPGAMSHAADLMFAEYAPDADLAIISPNDPAAMDAYAMECRELGIDYIYDPSQQVARIDGDALKKGLTGCKMLTLNEYEYSLIQEKTGLDESGILERVGGLLVTKAADGALLIVDGVRYHIPIVPPTEIVEPTGAGDAFRAGMMRGMQLGVSWDLAGRMGALAATYVLEQLGPQGHTYTPTEFVTRFREYFDDKGALDSLLK